MAVTGFDHAAIPTANSERFLAFYKALGFGVEGEDAWRAGTFPAFAITFGDNKINVHSEALYERSRNMPGFLRGPTAAPGCGDFCFVWDGGIDALLALLEDAGVTVIEGPVPRRGGRGRGTGQGVSVYVRDPDENLLEFMSYDPDDVARFGPSEY
jgi:catechol 2,3-dioxygenase-like lactoylglutathione lyase family enzyme